MTLAGRVVSALAVVVAAAATAATGVYGAAPFQCSRVPLRGGAVALDLSDAFARGPLHVSSELATPPSIKLTNVTMDLCKPLARTRAPLEEQCAEGTHVCMVVSHSLNRKQMVEEVVPSAGTAAGLSLVEPPIEEGSEQGT